ncbi:hypothetical protein [Prevotella melaninogenica]|uniref:hypothetical protein n=1 Tax=Prevotella melaninogenica TaxID=28132 RepID=UPI001C5F1510|nr:hypothetical protein [Prevotella melaninogenica]MBW4722847.1 HEPN domain-containing protein [Prevotella melaninogenica]
MKAKALDNLKVAQELINKKEACSNTVSIHCSYYAVLQYMKYILAHTDDPISYHEQTQQTKHQSSHEYVIIEIKQRISHPRDARDFVQDVRDLKKDRVEADYSERQFSLDESLTCRDQANRLISKLKRYFGDI